MENKKLVKDINLVMKNLIKELNEAREKYYNFGTSSLTDEEYDIKLQYLKSLEEKTGLKYANSPTNKVGYVVLSEIEKVKIPGKAMLSLQNLHTDNEVASWRANKDIIGSIKCDGLSCRLIYENGKLISANTRGDGMIGGNITEHIKYFVNVPLNIAKPGRYVIDGEAIIKFFDFEIINKNNEFKNPRNTAAGTLNTLDMSIVKQRRLSFIAWDVIEGGSNSTIALNLDEAHNLGFEIVYYISNYDNDKILNKAKELGIPCDGVVYKFNDIEYGNSLGGTEHHWSNAIAWKKPVQCYATKLLNIEYTMGRTGKLTPTAIFETIEIDGSECQRASLHNLSIMEQLFGTLCPEKYTVINVYKADEIIPQIKNVVSIGEGLPIPVPEACPFCGEQVKQETLNESTNLVCINPNCNSKLINRLDHFVGKKGLDIKGLSKATLEKLIDWGWVKSYEDIFHLEEHKTEWSNKSGFGIKSVENILGAIQEGRNCKLDKFIAALGIPLIGSRASKDLANHFGSWASFINAIETKFSFYDLPNFGVEMNNSLINFDYTEAIEIANNFLDITVDGPKTADTPLEGKIFVITGKLNNYKNRDELKTLIEALGGKVSGSISGKTNYLINNDVNSTSSKNASAKKLNIPIISEEDFLAMLEV